jgi:predicted permease
MVNTSKFLFSFSIIAFGLALGYLLQVLVRNEKIRLSIALDELRKLLQKVALLFFMPITFVGAIWIVDAGNATIAALPFLGIFALLVGGVLALAAARVLGLPSKQTGALFTCGSFTNIGSIGALICFVFLGEKGFGLVPIYKLFEEAAYYGIGFPIAKFYSSEGRGSGQRFEHLRGLGRDPFIIVALSSITVGGILNVSGIARPEFFRAVNSIFIPLGTIILLTSIGLAMQFRGIRNYLGECISVSLIKFILVPVLVSTAARMVGLGAIEAGLPLKVVAILSSMPVAFTALVPPSIYDLDLDLANSCWLFTTALLIPVLPALLYVVNSF